MCALSDEESYSNGCPWSSFHFSPAVKAQTSPAACDWFLFSLLSVLSEVVTAAPGAASCSQGSCHFALTCVIYCYHPCVKKRGWVRHLREETRGAYLDAPADPASTWNSTARRHGNKRTGVVACSVISLPPSDTYRAAETLNDVSPTRPLNTSHTMSLAESDGGHGDV